MIEVTTGKLLEMVTDLTTGIFAGNKDITADAAVRQAIVASKEILIRLDVQGQSEEELCTK